LFAFAVEKDFVRVLTDPPRGPTDLLY